MATLQDGKEVACEGCVGRDVPVKEDHRHQYINMLGITVSGTSVNGKYFHNDVGAMEYVKDILGCTSHEAFSYLQALPTKYN